MSVNGIFYLLRNPVYAGQMIWGKKIYASNHEAIISKELFDHAQGLTKEKIRKKILYKEYFLKGLVKCSECGSSMTPCFTNKMKRRYYYYKCVKVLKEGFNACSIKEVNAEKLESFLIEGLSRMALDTQYLNNLAFRMAHESPHPAGVELLKEVEKKLSTRMQQVLINFKNGIKINSQIEKCLIFRKTVKRINFSKTSLEVIVNIQDANGREVDGSVVTHLGGVVARERAGALDLHAPACSTTFESSNWCPVSIDFEPQTTIQEFTIVLPHSLLNKCHMK
jgi:hypothetical protein